MTIKLLLALAAVAAGVAATVQGAANAALSARAGLGAALLLNTGIVLVGALVFFLVSGARATFFPADTPWSLYVGGLCGFAVILAAAFVFPRIGAAPAVALMVLGQGAAALVIDHFGLMGFAREPVSLARIGSFALIVVGVALLRR
jgi:bacterial/archaeal transporter family-2 protein